MTQILFSVASLAAAVAIVCIVAAAVLTLESRRNRRMRDELELMLRRARDISGSVRDAR